MAEERAQLQRHFQIVERILLGDAARSLAIARARFEKSLSRPLSSEEQRRLGEMLSVRRMTQIARLAAYREAGRFPLNLDARLGPRPIFVDQQGTPCAVGYLMLCSGAFDEVASIVRENNFVVVVDAHQGPLVDWVATSGLTQEEAALIQPTYSPPSIYEGPLSQYLLPGASLERDGLMYSNFFLDSYLQGGASYNPDQIQLITDLSDITSTGNGMDDYKYFVPKGTNFLAFHGEMGRVFGPGDLLWVLDFDVTVTDPAKAISEIYLTGTHQHGWTTVGSWGIPGSSGYAMYMFGAWTDYGPLGNVSIGELPSDFWNNYLSASRGATFSPVQSMHVSLSLYLIGYAESHDVAIEFKLVPVPEPTPKSLWFIGLAALVCSYGVRAEQMRRRRR